jgi:hypothetical protein
MRSNMQFMEYNTSYLVNLQHKDAVLGITVFEQLLESPRRVATYPEFVANKQVVKRLKRYQLLVASCDISASHIKLTRYSEGQAKNYIKVTTEKLLSLYQADSISPYQAWYELESNLFNILQYSKQLSYFLSTAGLFEAV